VALGLARADPERGRTEVRSLLSGQWSDGMLPHIVFHPGPVGYSPGPEVWGSAACAGAPAVATSGLTQPPVLATGVRALHEAAPDPAFQEEVVPALHAWHRWLFEDHLLPLYAGVADEQQARQLHSQLLWSPERFGPSPAAPWAVTTVSKSSPDFDPRCYWRGPVWINMNWFLVRGLERYGLGAEADALRRLTLGLVDRSGFAEYYHPATGEPLGSGDFSWSAALTLDLL
jgi:hypothetical protein